MKYILIAYFYCHVYAQPVDIGSVREMTGETAMFPTKSSCMAARNALKKYSKVEVFAVCVETKRI